MDPNLENTMELNAALLFEEGYLFNNPYDIITSVNVLIS